MIVYLIKQRASTILSSVIIYVSSLFKSHKTVQFDFVDCSPQLGEKDALSPWILINCVNVVRKARQRFWL